MTEKEWYNTPANSFKEAFNDARRYRTPDYRHRAMITLMALHPGKTRLVEFVLLTVAAAIINRLIG